MPHSDSLIRRPAAKPSLWHLDPRIDFLNHGSFGACPKAVLAYQAALRLRLETEPVQFLVRDLEPMLDQARAALAKFVGARPANLVFVQNATAGINTVLRSLQFARGDELLVSDQEYNASRNALSFAAERSGATVVIAPIAFPLASGEQAIEAILGKVTRRTRLALLDHVTSQTGMVLPLAPIVRALEERGVACLIDGAHAPGMIPLALEKLGASYYAGNCHKWICAPKGAGFLYVRPDKQQPIRPLVISHGANSPRTDRSRLQIEFGWTGTWDPTAMLTVPEALRYMGTLLPGGWDQIMQRNRQLALAARSLLCRALKIEPPCPDSLIGTLASVPLPPGKTTRAPKSPLYLDAFQEKLYREQQIEVPIIPWPAPPARLLRISAQLYNSLPQFERLARRLAASAKE